MKPPRNLGARPHVRYRPELIGCPRCHGRPAYSHSVWSQWVHSLDRLEQVTSLGYRCSSEHCPGGRTVSRSAQAEARQVKGSTDDLDVIARIGALRFGQQRTRAEIWQELETDTPIQIAERHVQNLIAIYLALPRASQQDLALVLAPTLAQHGGLILSLEGLQPEQGNEQLWVVREVLSGAIRGAANLQQATAPMLATLLRPMQAAGLPVLGVVSDAHESLRLAVAAVFPDVPPPLCQ